jgi:hypothetical protein
MKLLSKPSFHAIAGGGCANDAAAALAATAAAAATCSAAGVASVACAAAVGAAVTSAVSANESCTAATAASPGSVSCTADTDALGNQTGSFSCSDSGGGGGGGKVICTELCRNGAIEHEVWMADIRYSRQNFSEQTMRGYHLWGIPYVKLMRKYPLFAKLVEHPTRWFAEDIAYRMGVLPKPNHKGWILREVFFRPVCFGIGLFAKARDWQALWRDGVTPAGVRS